MEGSRLIYIQPDKIHTKVLKERFGQNFVFKDQQWEVIRALIYDKRDCLIVAGTGFGKSLIYQFPPVFLKKIAIIVSPLISLIQDQVIALQSKGIRACSLDSTQKDRNIKLNRFQVIYLTPEFFCGPNGEATLGAIKDKICLVAIDECHCITQWGSSFRPKYKSLAGLRSFLPNVPIVGLTATATDYCLSDVCQSLHLETPLIIKADLNRPNLSFSVIRRGDSFVEDVKHYLIGVTSGSVIIYVLRRRDAEHYSEALSREGIVCRPYHARMRDNDRGLVLREFAEGKLRYIVATIAFGMGIDRADVRIVIHYGVPRNIECYYQESGRAGRDGEPSKCIIFWEDRDFQFHRSWLNRKRASEYRTRCENSLKEMADFVISPQCRRMKILSYFDATTPTLPVRESCCDNCKRSLYSVVELHKLYKEIDKEGFLNIAADVRLLLELVKSYHGKCHERRFLNLFLGEMPSKHCKRHPLGLFAKGKSKPEAWWLKIAKLMTSKKLIKRHIKVNRIPVANEGDDADVEWIVRRSDLLKITNRGRKFLRRKSLDMKERPSLDMFQFLTKTDEEYYIEDDLVKCKPRAHPQPKHKKVSLLKTPPTSKDLFKFDHKAIHISPEKVSQEETSKDSKICEVVRNLFHRLENPNSGPKVGKDPVVTDSTRETAKCEQTPTVNDGAGCSSWSTSKTETAKPGVAKIKEDEEESHEDWEADEYLQIENFKESYIATRRPLEVDLDDLCQYLENQREEDLKVEVSKADASDESSSDESRDRLLSFETDIVMTPPSMDRIDLITDCTLHYALEQLANERFNSMDMEIDEIFPSKVLRLSQESVKS